ncbi:MAG TPA: UPF0182 family protein [Actinomycetota bacterium]|nr:UPF0182 family protein [Actinomycetota bacterium]
MSTIRLPTSRSRRWPLIIIAVLVVLAVLFTALSGAVVDLLWYREIGQTGVFWTAIRTRFLLGLVFGLLFFGLLYVNLLIARRIRPTTRILTPDQQILDRFRDVSDPFLRWLLPVGAAVIAFLVAIGVSGEWKTYLLWRGGSGIMFGNPDPLFHRDPSFYIFTMPWLRFLQGWLFSSLVGVTIIVSVAHLLWGGIRPQAPMFADKVTPAARAHLSVLLGLIMLVKAWGYWLGRYDLLTSTRGVVEGASYTDVKAQLPALNFLTIVAVICALLFFANIRLKQWSLPVIAVGLLLLVSVLLGTAYPAFVQQFRVKPNEQTYEQKYIGDNIEATNIAFGLDQIHAQDHPVTGPLTAQQIQDNSGTVSNIRVWRGVPILQENFQSLQRQRQYYDFDDVDVDRYPIDGQERVLMVSPREIDQAGLAPAAQTWPNEHLTYTHGYGAVAAQVNTATSQGQPVFRLQDLPPVTKDAALDMQQPEIYFGESNDVPFVVTNTNIHEDNPQGGETAPYSGPGGIQLSNFLRRAVFSWHFRDYNLLVSSSITPQSRIMIYRDIQTRIRKPVPFLGFDSDPYFAIIDGQPEWIWDAYTYTNQYPYSQSVDVGDATGGLLQGNVNYLRNSVKAVMNAYTGQITYYAFLTGSQADPIVRAWANAFPGLFTDITQAPADVMAHFRYPENLFQVQAFQYTNYHVLDPIAFYQKSDFWAVPGDPTVPATQAAVTMRPSYQLIRLPGQSQEAFQLVIPFVPADRQNMVAWMAASSDPGDYGALTVFRLPEGRNIEGPVQVMSRINQDPTFSAQRTLLGQGGSTVQFGDFLVIPIDDSFLYVVPVYVRAVQEAAVPELKQVIIVNGSQGQVSLGPDLASALRQAVTGLPGGGGNGGGTPPPTGSIEQQIQRLLADAQTHFQNAETALKGGDLGTYQSEIDAAQKDVEQAALLTTKNQGSGSSGSSGASPSASPSPGG